jgi:hypothetical protein
MLDLEVIKEGQIRVQGFLSLGISAIVVTEKAINMCNPGALNSTDPRPLVMIGAGDETVLIFTGPIDAPMFRFE